MRVDKAPLISAFEAEQILYGKFGPKVIDK